MYIIIEILGKQYKVFEGSTININLLNYNINDIFFINKILLISNKKKSIILNNEFLNKIIIISRILKIDKLKKIRTLKFKRRKHYKKNKNYKQILITLLIEKFKFIFL